MGIEKPELIQGTVFVDDRGSLSAINDCDFSNVKRCYWVVNHRAGLVRAWHAHRREGKFVLVVAGAAVVGAVKVDKWEDPSRDLPVERVVLSARRPCVFYIPPGYANGTMNLTANTKIMFFSTTRLDEARDDDIRYPANHWDIWDVVER